MSLPTVIPAVPRRRSGVGRNGLSNWLQRLVPWHKAGIRCLASESAATAIEGALTDGKGMHTTRENTPISYRFFPMHFHSSLSKSEFGVCQSRTGLPGREMPKSNADQLAIDVLGRTSSSTGLHRKYFNHR
jgi:hypothetical protein